MVNKEKKTNRFLLILLSSFLLVSISGCEQIEEDVTEMEQNVNPETKEELIDGILKFNPNLSGEELHKETKEQLESIYNDLKHNREQREKDLINKIEEKEKPEYHYQEDDPNPPDPPIYEKPKPVPDPPIEEK